MPDRSLHDGIYMVKGAHIHFKLVFVKYVQTAQCLSLHVTSVYMVSWYKIEAILVHHDPNRF